MYKSIFLGCVVSLTIHHGYCYGMDNQNESLEVENKKLIKKNEELKQQYKDLKDIAGMAGERLTHENQGLRKEIEDLRDSSIKITPGLYGGIGLASFSLLVLGYLGGVLLHKGSVHSK